jgi:hypothetical protein
VTPTLTTAGPPNRSSIALLNIGFLTVLHEACGYFRSYLVTNTWGRTLEFRLGNALQPNRVRTSCTRTRWKSHVGADLIGNTLIDQPGVPG